MNIFQSIAGNRTQYSKFNLSHERKMSLNMGNLVPILVQEIVPGDKFRISSEMMMRMAPMLAPVMHRINADIHYFFVPNRLIWEEWEDFITGGRDGLAAPVHPQFLLSNLLKDNWAAGSLADYMGLPTLADPNGTNVTNEVAVSCLPFRAYQLIFNEYYQDQNLSTPVPLSFASGLRTDITELGNMITMRKRAWEKDYFTSALPWAQRGGEALLPMQADVNYKSVSNVYTSTGGTISTSNRLIGTGSGSGLDELRIDMDAAGDATGVAGRIENIEDISNATTTINDLRKAVRLQEWLERAARGGSRYIEQILSHFGVKSSDARLQRPEYLGGGTNHIVISEVLNMAGPKDDTSDLSPQGTMTGHGISVGNNGSFSKAFEEHGYIIGILSVLPRTTYQDGIPKHFQRFDKFDYYWPEFANLGEQEVQNGELYHNWTGDTNDTTFGYQSRYAEYKYQQSTVHGDFKTNLEYWHMGRKFIAPPSLNEGFITSDPTTRIFAVEDPNEDHLYCQLYHKIDALRPMPRFGTPTL